MPGRVLRTLAVAVPEKVEPAIWTAAPVPDRAVVSAADVAVVPLKTAVHSRSRIDITLIVPSPRGV